MRSFQTHVISLKERDKHFSQLLAIMKPFHTESIPFTLDIHLWQRTCDRRLPSNENCTLVFLVSQYITQFSSYNKSAFEQQEKD